MFGDMILNKDVMKLRECVDKPDDAELEHIDLSMLDETISGCINTWVLPHEKYIEMGFYDIGSREYRLIRIYSACSVGIYRWKVSEVNSNAGNKR